MLDINNPVQWQQKDDKFPTLKPWFTYGMLNELDKWDLSDKKIFEWGAGWSTVYWAYHCKSVYAIETNEEWINDIIKYLLSLGWIIKGKLSEDFRFAVCAESEQGNKITIEYRECNEGNQEKVDFYTSIPDDYNPDIVIVDGILRHECLLKALTLPRPLIIIHDNWQQDGFVCPASEEVMKEFEIHNFIQEDHTDNHGRKWATAYWKPDA